MHNLCDYIDTELRELDRKASGGKLSMSELEYGDKLAHFKKSILTNKAMEESDEYGDYNARDGRGRYREGRYNAGRSGGSGGGRRGGYSRGYRDDGDMMDELRDMMEYAPNEQTRRKIRDFMSELKTMM